MIEYKTAFWIITILLLTVIGTIQYTHYNTDIQDCNLQTVNSEGEVVETINTTTTDYTLDLTDKGCDNCYDFKITAERRN